MIDAESSPSRTRTAVWTGLLSLLVASSLLNAGPGSTARADELPAGPAYVRATQSDGAVDMSWSPPVGAQNTTITGYVACIAPGTCTTVGPTDWTVTFPGLINGQRYHPYVAATTSAGQGPSVFVEGGVLAAGVPGMPLDLTASSRPGGVVRLSWSGVADHGQLPTVYTYGRSDGQGVSHLDVASWHQDPPSTTGAGPYFVDLVNLRLGMTYEYSVSATNGTGTGRPATVSFTVGAPFLQPGLSLPAGQTVTSRSGAYSLVLQADGNVVVHHSGGRAVWHSWTWGQAAGRLVFQVDGNLVAYGRDGRALWHTDTWGHPDAQLHLADDGRLVLFDSTGMTLWSSAADAGPSVNNNALEGAQQLTAAQTLYSPYGYYRLVLQADGNAVVHRRDGRVVWHSWTFGMPGSRMTMQPDGNLVIRSPGRGPVWNAGTWGHPGSRVLLQDDGNLVVYAPTGQALWSSMYGRAR